MALITRVSRLFRADLHAVLDRIEEPDDAPRDEVVNLDVRGLAAREPLHHAAVQWEMPAEHLLARPGEERERGGARALARAASRVVTGVAGARRAHASSTLRSEVEWRDAPARARPSHATERDGSAEPPNQATATRATTHLRHHVPVRTRRTEVRGSKRYAMAR